MERFGWRQMKELAESMRALDGTLKWRTVSHIPVSAPSLKTRPATYGSGPTVVLAIYAGPWIARRAEKSSSRTMQPELFAMKKSLLFSPAGTAPSGLAHAMGGFMYCGPTCPDMVEFG